MSIKKTGIALAGLLLSAYTWGACEKNVDNIESYYINGMFTDLASYNLNKSAIEGFISNYLVSKGFSTTIQGTHNQDEFALFQLLEVAKHKWEDDDAADAIIAFLNDEHTYLSEDQFVDAVKEFLNEISQEYSGTLSEEDTSHAIEGVESLLDTCSRVVLITHSQGNFYGNAVLNELYSHYFFTNGYALADYPMLGAMQIASPVDIPGGVISRLYPEVVGHLTNDNDAPMAIVRTLFNSVEANYQSPENIADSSGHGLDASYLNVSGQATEIARQMTNIAYDLIPYPMHGQSFASSSALAQFGYSDISQFLDIAFHDGSVYRYENVPLDVYNNLITASSQGRYFNASIRNNYETSRIE